MATTHARPDPRTHQATARASTGAPDWTRTSNRRLRRPMLYPIELRAQLWRILASNLPWRDPCWTFCLPRSCAAGHWVDLPASFASHSPRPFPHYASLVGAEGFEPPTSSSQSWRSTRLSYTPACSAPCAPKRLSMITVLENTRRSGAIGATPLAQAQRQESVA